VRNNVGLSKLLFHFLIVGASSVLGPHAAHADKTDVKPSLETYKDQSFISEKTMDKNTRISLSFLKDVDIDNHSSNRPMETIEVFIYPNYTCHVWNSETRTRSRVWRVQRNSQFSTDSSGNLPEIELAKVRYWQYSSTTSKNYRPLPTLIFSREIKSKNGSVLNLACLGPKIPTPLSYHVTEPFLKEWKNQCVDGGGSVELIGNQPHTRFFECTPKEQLSYQDLKRAFSEKGITIGFTQDQNYINPFRDTPNIEYLSHDPMRYLPPDDTEGVL
jgi:hypothetical protein